MAKEAQPPTEAATGENAGSPQLYGPYHRLESPTQTAEIAELQETSGELWGRPPQGSDIPAVQAYKGHLPSGARGIEFYTPVEPDSEGSGRPGALVYWRPGNPGVVEEDDYVKIPIQVTVNRQR